MTTLARETDLKVKQVRRVLETIGSSVVRDGKGRKGDPFTYRLEPASLHTGEPS